MQHFRKLLPGPVLRLLRPNSCQPGSCQNRNWQRQRSWDYRHRGPPEYYVQQWPVSWHAARARLRAHGTQPGRSPEPIAETERLNRLCELNVIEQVLNVSRTTIVQNAWGRGQELAVHGWIYGIGDGLLRDLDICITNQTELLVAYEHAVGNSGSRRNT